MQEFEGRVALVTGAASGIGLALCEIFAEQGMNIVAADVEADPLADTAERIESLGVDCLAVQCDVSDPGAVEELAQAAIETFGAIHIACNNAGVFTGGTL